MGWMAPPPNKFGAEQQYRSCGPSWSHIQVFAVGYFRVPSQGHPSVFLNVFINYLNKEIERILSKFADDTKMGERDC